MSDSQDVKSVSVRVEATQAVKSLVLLEGSFTRASMAAGTNEQILRTYQRTVNNSLSTINAAATTIARLRREYSDLSVAQTAATNANAKLSSRLLTANKKIEEQRQIIQTQKSVILGITKANLELAGSYDRVASSASRAGQGMKNTQKGITVNPNLGAPLVQTPQGYFPNGAVPLNKIGGGGNPVKGAVDALNTTVQTNALRYQLYDVSATFGILGRAALEAGLAVTKTGIEWDKNFANVVRTSQVTGYAVGWLKEQFLDLQTAIPVTAADLATIGTLGAQMGIAASDLAHFTGVTARFSATAGISVDESATALSRLDVLLPDVQGNYERLASTILKTGVNSVATEGQIVRGTNLIASMGQIAGLTTPEVVALASSMASLGFTPELARSVITSSFSRILTATSEVTDKTEKFGAVLHMTGKEFQTAWRADAVGTYRNLLQAIASRGDAVTVLQDLSLASQRLTPNLLKLGQNVDVLDSALRDTRGEWQKNTELTRQYDIIAKTVSARIQVLGQSWDALLVTLDQSDSVVGTLVDWLNAILKWMRDIAKTPGLNTLVTLGSVITTLVGITALGAAGLAALAAGYIAITNAASGLNALSVTNTATNAVNTGATVLNTEAKLANAAANLAAADATSLDSIANGVNAVSMTGAGGALLNMTRGVITSLPSILKWTGIIGLAAAAVSGLGVVLATAPDWSLDLEKTFKGIDTVPKTITFDTGRIKSSLKDISDGWQSNIDKKMKESLGTQTLLNVATSGPGAGFADAFDSWFSDPNQKMNAAKKDIVDTVSSLDTMEQKLAAVNAISKKLGVSQEYLLSVVLPDLGDVMGADAASAAQLQDATEKLAGAQELWAAVLNSNDEVLSGLQTNMKSAAGGFLDFGDSLKTAYDKGAKGPEAIKAFVSGMGTQLSSFESFYGDLGTLIQHGGIQLASFFAAQGPEAAQALTDSLNLDGAQISQIEDQMSLAAFYASDAFAQTFAQNNSILAQVWTQSGHNPDAVAAFNKALAESMKNGTIDPAVLAQLEKQFGVKITAQMIPDLNPDDFEKARNLAEASILPIKVPVTTNVGQGDFTVTKQVENWIVEMDGHSITMNVDPNTERGRDILTAWRANEYSVPIELQTYANTTNAKNVLDAFIGGYISKSYYINFRATMKDLNGSVSGTGRFGTIATGGLIHNSKIVRDSYPGYANGTIFRGPGSGTSDSILARVSNGEAITRARAVRHYGTQMMDDINKMKFPRYATGTSYGPGSPNGGAGTIVNATVVQNYPTTQDPIKKLKSDAEAVLSGIWI